MAEFISVNPKSFGLEISDSVKTNQELIEDGFQVDSTYIFSDMSLLKKPYTLIQILLSECMSLSRKHLTLRKSITTDGTLRLFLNNSALRMRY